MILLMSDFSDPTDIHISAASVIGMHRIAHLQWDKTPGLVQGKTKYITPLQNRGNLFRRAARSIAYILAIALRTDLTVRLS
jgi:hypothetical protein